MNEASRYDRQIRVWGAEAQARIQNSKVLIINLSNLNVEVSIRSIIGLFNDLLN
jgi:molybdopterin/thiamine biosynthesis adenylyltransferase